MLIKDYGNGSLWSDKIGEYNPIYTSGSTMVFRIYGLVCAGMLVLFTLVNFYNMKEGGFSTELGEDIDPRNVSILQSRKHQVNIPCPGDGV